MLFVVAAFILKNSKFLIARRAKGELKGYWEFPGGKIENNESPFEAIKREINEELGLKIQPVKIINTFTHKYDFADISMDLIKCNLITKIVTIKGSHTEVKWINLNDEKIQFTPLDKKIFDYLKRNNILS